MFKKIIYILLLSSFIYASTQTKEIKIEGLTQISNVVAMEITKFKADEEYSDELINNAIKNFYEFNYFTDIWVTRENNIVTFHFKEKPFIASLDMNGYKSREEDLDVLYASMNIKKGNMYSHTKVQRAKKNLLKELEREGYINSVVEVEVENINESSVAVKFLVNKGDEIIITKVDYNGAKELKEDIFEESTANKQKDSFSWWFGQNNGVMSFEQVEYDGYRIKESYLENGFLDAKVATPFSKIDFNTNTSQIQFDIEEGKQYTVNSTVIYLDENIKSPDELYPELFLQKDDIFNIKYLRKDIEFIKTEVSNLGYAFTEVRYDIRRDKETGKADLIFNVIPGDKVYINDVIISGNSRTLDRVIRRNIYLAPEDLYSLTDFKDSKNALKRTGFFSTVDIQQQRVSKSKMNLLVNVSEASTGNLVLGGGYGSYDGWMINASVNDKNIFGSGLNLGFSIDHSSVKDTASLSLSDPAINDGIYNGSVSIYKKESIIKTIDDNSTSGDEITNTTGASIGVGRSIGRHTRIGVNYTAEEVEVLYDLNTSANSVYTTSGITPYISFNNTDDYYVPRKGMMAGSSLKITGLGGNADYILSSSYFKYFHSLEKKYDVDWIIRYKTTLKILEDTGEIPDNTSFYLGGPSSVRGYESYAFNPDDYSEYVTFKKYWTNTIELSFPLLPSAKMRWALFYDYGMVGENRFTDIKKSGRGAVISWYSPVGPLQFIFSEAVNPDADDKTSSFEFSLGSKF